MPTHSPFEPGPTQWPSIVGECIAPVFRGETDVLYWFCNHGRNFQVCFASDNFQTLHAKLLHRTNTMMGVSTLTLPTAGATVATAFGGSRWASKNQGTAAEARTSELTLRLLHAACELYIDMLFQPPSARQWTRDINRDPNNPRGSAFESIFHLIANLSETDVEIEILARTPFMAAAGTKVAVKL